MVMPASRADRAAARMCAKSTLSEAAAKEVTGSEPASKARWTWVSMRPGSRQAERPRSMTSLPSAGSAPVRSTRTMRPPETCTVAGPDRLNPSNIEPACMAREFIGISPLGKCVSRGDSLREVNPHAFEKMTGRRQPARPPTPRRFGTRRGRGATHGLPGQLTWPRAARSCRRAAVPSRRARHSPYLASSPFETVRRVLYGGAASPLDVWGA